MMIDRCLPMLRRPRQSTACICNVQSSIFSMSEDANLVVSGPQTLCQLDLITPDLY